jgi:hypothetical protein
LSFIPLVNPASISLQAAVTCPVLVAGWTERRERRWTMSEPAFLRRGVGFESIGIADIAPSDKKGMAQTLRDVESADFRVLQPNCNSL